MIVMAGWIDSDQYQLLLLFPQKKTISVTNGVSVTKAGTLYNSN